MKKIYAIFWNVLLLLACQCLADVRMPPLITTFPSREVIFKADSTVTLPCVASGIPEPSYKWIKDGVDLEMSSRITMDPGVGTIKISAANKYQDNGKYQCIAINPHGEALSLVVTLNQTELVFTSPNDPTETTRIEGESLKLVLFERLTSVPIAKYDWKIVDRVTNVGPVLQTNARIAVDQATGSLYFANILPNDQPSGNNIYKLDVTNSFEDATYGGSPYSLLVTPNSDKENRAPARMVPEVEQYTQIAIKGRSTTIKCFFEGLPTPTVEWRMPSTGPPPNRIDCTQQSNTECLITAVEYSDEGVYTCIGRNSQGSVAVEITLSVQSVPTFVTAPASSNATAGGSKSFYCRADAVPPATITWYSNGNEISRDDPGSSRILISEDGTNLTVTQLCKTCQGDPASDLQVFQCKMSNVHGDTYGSAYLNVIEPVVIYDRGDVQDVIVDPNIGEKLETNFTCRATVDELILDSLVLVWWHGEQRVYDSHIHSIRNNGENIYINLTGVPEDDVAQELGEYTCVATATGTSKKAIYSFNIKEYTPPVTPPGMRMPPFITTFPSREVLFKFYSTVVLPCVATGIPEPSYKWLKNGQDLKMSSRITMDHGVGTIRISSANKFMDYGEYQCIAINPFGEALSLVVTLLQTEFIFNTPNEPINIARLEGESLKLVLHEKLTSIPTAKYEWKVVDRVTNVGSFLQTSARIAVDQATGSLYFANLLPSDQPSGNNIYKLYATNWFHDATYGGAPYSLLVTANPNKENRAPARMVPEVEQYTQIVKKGSSTTIKCFFEGLPTPTVDWRIPSTGPPPNRIDCTQQFNTECLITAVEYSDEGVYTCTGSNTQGSVAVEITLLVQSVPTFAIAPASSNATAGGYKSFICRPDAVSQATITWYSNRREISRENPGSNRILISEDGTNLTVTQLCKTCQGEPASDLQVFQCKLSNVHGDTYGSAYLNVIDPVVIYDRGDVQDIVVDPIIGEKLETNFTCRASVDELISDRLELVWWHRGQRVCESYTHAIENNGENLYINLTGLPEDDIAWELGEYTCVAGAIDTCASARYTFNIKGKSPPGRV